MENEDKIKGSEEELEEKESKESKKERKEKKEEQTPKTHKMHEKIHEKALLARHHIKRNGWKYLSIVLLIAIVAFAVLTALKVFTVSYNGFSRYKFTMIVLGDKRCAECNETLAQLVPQLKSLFPEARVIELDYSDAKAKRIFNETGIKYLPAVLFDDKVSSAANYSIIKPYLDQKGNYTSLRIGASFDPRSEICDNGIDDNGNSLVDCKDEECANSMQCREEKPKNLQLYIMSDCPYGKMAVIALGEIVNAIPEMSYEIHYIADETSPGAFSSLHGTYEADEDIVQLCVKKYSPQQWLNYMVCRSKQGVRGNDWHECAKNTSVNVEQVEACFKGDEGKKLLSEDIKIAHALGIGASPTWIANNRYQFGGIYAENVKQQFCSHNPGLAGCNTTINQTTTAPSGSCG